MSTTVEELIKATESLKVSINLLQEALTQQATKIELHKALRDACIQRYEFCVELSWKTSVKVLGLDVKAPNPAIRAMAQNHLIDDPQIWFDFLIARNKTSHTYDEDVARTVYLEAERIIPELTKLITEIKKIK